MSRTLHFQQIIDSRFEPIEECLPILQERINRIKELLNIEVVNRKENIMNTYIGGKRNRKFYVYGEPQIGYSVYSDGTPEGDKKAIQTMQKLIDKRDGK